VRRSHRQIDFTDYFWLLTTGDRPTGAQKTILNACLVAIAEHGLVPSVQAARMTLAAAPDAWQGAMAAGLLGMGSVVAGSSEIAGNYIEELIAQADSDGDLEAVVVASLKDLQGAAPEGAGPRPSAAQRGDPRAEQADADRRRAGVSGRLRRDAPPARAARARIMERPLPINVSGAIPAVILDAGWPPGRDQGHSASGAAGGLVGASAGGVAALDRLHHVASGRSGHLLRRQAAAARRAQRDGQDPQDMSASSRWAPTSRGPPPRCTWPISAPT
jgi:hypothetical protein